MFLFFLHILPMRTLGSTWVQPNDVCRSIFSEAPEQSWTVAKDSGKLIRGGLTLPGRRDAFLQTSIQSLSVLSAVRLWRWQKEYNVLYVAIMIQNMQLLS